MGESQILRGYALPYDAPSDHAMFSPSTVPQSDDVVANRAEFYIQGYFDLYAEFVGASAHDYSDTLRQESAHNMGRSRIVIFIRVPQTS